MSKRTFIGIKVSLDNENKAVFSELKRELADERIRWVSHENLHVTLHFLGETSDEQLVKVIKLIDYETAEFVGFLMNLKGLSFFKKQSSPSAVFFNLNDTDELEELAKSLKSGLSKLGFSVGRKFKPHLTIGRVKYLKDRDSFYNLMEDFEDTEPQLIKVENIILFESILKPGGPVYKPIKVFHLK